MLSFQSLSYAHSAVKGDTDNILTKLLESFFEGTFIVFGFTFTETNDTIQVTDEKEDTSMVDSV
jgi:hypothetical protein